MIDLWPKELTVVEQRSPLTILKEQAALLGEKTKNVVVAVVEENPAVAQLPKGYPFKYGFLLTCPALGHYRFGLFSVAYGIDMYPVRFTLDSDVSEELIEGTDLAIGKGVEDGLYTASNEQEFLDILKQIFSSKKTLRVIHALLSQAGA